MEPIVFGALLIGSVGLALLAAYGVISFILGLMMGTTTGSVRKTDAKAGQIQLT
jgi:hypothetical protein